MWRINELINGGAGLCQKNTTSTLCGVLKTSCAGRSVLFLCGNGNAAKGSAIKHAPEIFENLLVLHCSPKLNRAKIDHYYGTVVLFCILLGESMIVRSTYSIQIDILLNVCNVRVAQAIKALTTMK